MGEAVNELSLFSGAGGGLLGTKLLGWRHIGYVEWNKYCQRVIRARIDDGILDNAPIFGDVRAFISSGCASLYRGVTDVVTGGFPCQPFSTAGRMLGANDERNMWPATIECIRLVRPSYALLENVPGLLASGYFGTVLGYLAAAGYDCRWSILSACAVGAPHTRERLFMLAYANSQRIDRWRERQGSGKINGWYQAKERSKHNTTGKGSLSSQIWNSAGSDFLRMADGLGAKVDRIRAVGNGQVPAVVAAAWNLLSEGLT